VRIYISQLVKRCTYYGMCVSILNGDSALYKSVWGGGRGRIHIENKYVPNENQMYYSATR